MGPQDLGVPSCFLLREHLSARENSAGIFALVYIFINEKRITLGISTYSLEHISHTQGIDGRFCDLNHPYGKNLFR